MGFNPLKLVQSKPFFISTWRAWSPGLSEQSDWALWKQGALDFVADAQPDISFLPVMQRRRLSPLAKAVLFSAQPILATRDIPLLCCSVHGEARRTYSLLKDVAAKSPLSPTAFGLSVHNAIAGQLSIAFGIRSTTLALAGGDYPLLTGLLEAIGMLTESVPELLLLFYEEPLPEAYLPSTQNSQILCVTALHLCTKKVEPGTSTLPTAHKAKLLYSTTQSPVSAFEGGNYQFPLIKVLVDGVGRVPLGQQWELFIND